MASTHKFPSPVGGVAFPSDFAPSIIFAIMYGLLLPLLVYRICKRNSRNTLLGGSLGFGVERIVIFSLRAVQAHHTSLRESKGMNAYMQSTIGAGFIAISQDLVQLLRAALVNSTHPSTDDDDDDDDTPPSKLMWDSSTPSLVILRISDEPEDYQEDKPRQRYWYRRLSDFLYVGFLGALVPGIIGNSTYNEAVDKPDQATLVMRLRYASSAIALFFSIILGAIAIWASKKIPRFKKNAGFLTLFICCLSSITTIYRLCVMDNTTTSLTSISQGSQNTPAEKAAFYIFHMIPEWISVLILLSCNMRDVFDTGMFGDNRFRDETQREKEAREAKELYKAERQMRKNVGIQDEDFAIFSILNHSRRCKV